MVKGIPHIDHSYKFCESCVLEKYLRNSFLKEVSYRAKKVFKLVHTDICGLITSNLLDKHWYFITFIDVFFEKLGFIF
jgi:hypothetical protein